MRVGFGKLRSRLLVGAFLVGVALAVPLAALAQQGESGGGNQTNAYTLSQDTYNVVTRVQKLMGDGHYGKARSLAESLIPRVRREGQYPLALVDQLIAQTYLLQKNYDAAEPYLEDIVRLDALQPQSQLSVISELATIYLTQNKFDNSIRLYKEVIAQERQKKQTPDPSLYYHLGLAYSLKGDYQHAYDYIGQAIGMSKEKHQNWYENWFITAYKLNNLRKANQIAKQLVLNWPKNKDYWTYLSNTYLLMHEDNEATAVYGLMYHQGLLRKKDEYLQLASLYLESRAPYKAAAVLQDGLDKGVIPKTADNYDTLAGALIQARSWKKALDALGEEAKLSPNGDVYLRQAEIYLNQQDWADAQQAARNAISKGGLKDPGHAWMLAGEAAFGRKDWNAALDAFHQAENYKNQAKAARSWVQYVNVSRSAGGAGQAQGSGGKR